MRADEKIALKMAAKFVLPVVILFFLCLGYAKLFSLYGEVLFQNSFTKTIVSIFYPICMIFALNTPITYLKKKHAYEVDMMFYFLCLSSAISLVVTIAAVEFGAIDSSGNFSGKSGEWFEAGLDFFMSVKHTFYLSAAIVFITIVPQILSYMLSGLFGCASRIVYASEIIELSFWLAVKPLITVSGISIGLSLAAYILSIKGFSIDNIFTMIAMSSAMLYFTFGIVCIYKVIKDFMQGEDSRIPQRCKNLIVAIHKKATQHNKPKQEEGISTIILGYIFNILFNYTEKQIRDFLIKDKSPKNNGKNTGDPGLNE